MKIKNELLNTSSVKLEQEHTIISNKIQNQNTLITDFLNKNYPYILKAYSKYSQFKTMINTNYLKTFNSRVIKENKFVVGKYIGTEDSRGKRSFQKDEAYNYIEYEHIKLIQDPLKRACAHDVLCFRNALAQSFVKESRFLQSFSTRIKKANGIIAANIPFVDSQLDPQVYIVPVNNGNYADVELSIFMTGDLTFYFYLRTENIIIDNDNYRICYTWQGDKFLNFYNNKLLYYDVNLENKKSKKTYGGKFTLLMHDNDLNNIFQKTIIHMEPLFKKIETACKTMDYILQKYCKLAILNGIF